jgi:hypothetical protein
MVSKRLKVLRIVVSIILVLLALQFEFGMAVNLSTLPELPTIQFYSPQFTSYLSQAGPVANVHADLGAMLGVLSIAILVLSLRSGVRGIQVFGVLAFVAVILAGITGFLFVSSGFQNDAYSHGMATNFILAFGFYFLELYVLKPAA